MLTLITHNKKAAAVTVATALILSGRQPHSRRSKFMPLTTTPARAAVFAEFGRHAFAIDQGDFIDRKPWELRRP